MGMELLMLLFLELSTHFLGATRNDHVIELFKSRAEAQSYCRAHFDDLATIETAEDWADMEAIATSDYKLWIGLYYDPKEWRWSKDNIILSTNDGHDGWFDLTSDDITVDQHGTVHVLHCSLLLKSVCYDDSTNKYIAVTAEKTWWSARDNCREEYTDLTSMRSQPEKDEIMKLIDQSDWWIGLSRELRHWPDQTKYKFRAWMPGEPDELIENCAAVHSEGWVAMKCSKELHFICSAIPMMKLVKVVLKPEGLVDMNVALVQEAVLKQIEQLMKNHMIQRLRLSWKTQPNGKVFNSLVL